MCTCEGKGYLVLGGWAPDNSLISETASEIETLASFNKLPFFKFSTHKQLCLERQKSAWGQWLPPLLAQETSSCSYRNPLLLILHKRGPCSRPPECLRASQSSRSPCQQQMRAKTSQILLLGPSSEDGRTAMEDALVLQTSDRGSACLTKARIVSN